MNPVQLIAVNEPSQAGHARRTVAALAHSLGFSEELEGRAALIATELATNLVTHAREGELLVRGLEEGKDGFGMELLAVDRGPGMVDVDRCLADGFSTGGTAGKGLGAVRRMAHLFDIHSIPGKGTVVLARLWSAPPPRERPAFEVGVVCVPYPGEEVAGDGWACHVRESRGWFLVVDGLGHGSPAATAAHAAGETFLARPERAPTEQLLGLHEALHSTRGAAAALAELNADTGQIRYAGVGNIAGTAVVGGRTQRMVSMNGTLGHVIPRMQEFQYAWGEEGLLVMHSDGLATSWKLEAFSGLTSRHPSVIAATLYRDYRRLRDDVTVLVVKGRRGSA